MFYLWIVEICHLLCLRSHRNIIYFGAIVIFLMFYFFSDLVITSQLNWFTYVSTLALILTLPCCVSLKLRETNVSFQLYKSYYCFNVRWFFFTFYLFFIFVLYLPSFFLKGTSFRKTNLVKQLNFVNIYINVSISAKKTVFWSCKHLKACEDTHHPNTLLL